MGWWILNTTPNVSLPSQDNREWDIVKFAATEFYENPPRHPPIVEARQFAEWEKPVFSCSVNAAFSTASLRTGGSRRATRMKGQCTGGAQKQGKPG